MEFALRRSHREEVFKTNWVSTLWHQKHFNNSSAVYLTNKEASIVLCSVVKHAGIGRAQKKCRGKHSTTSRVFLPYWVQEKPSVQWNVIHSTKKIGYNFRNFRMSYGIVFSTWLNRSLSVKIGQISRQDVNCNGSLFLDIFTYSAYSAVLWRATIFTSYFMISMRALPWLCYKD